MEKAFEIYWKDLTLEAQERFREEVPEVDPNQSNWDVFPMATIYLEV